MNSKNKRRRSRESYQSKRIYEGKELLDANRRPLLPPPTARRRLAGRLRRGKLAKAPLQLLPQSPHEPPRRPAVIKTHAMRWLPCGRLLARSPLTTVRAHDMSMQPAEWGIGGHRREHMCAKTRRALLRRVAMKRPAHVATAGRSWCFESKSWMAWAGSSSTRSRSTENCLAFIKISRMNRARLLSRTGIQHEAIHA